MVLRVLSEFMFDWVCPVFEDEGNRIYDGHQSGISECGDRIHGEVFVDSQFMRFDVFATETNYRLMRVDGFDGYGGDDLWDPPQDWLHLHNLPGTRLCFTRVLDNYWIPDPLRLGEYKTRTMYRGMVLG